MKWIFLGLLIVLALFAAALIILPWKKDDEVQISRWLPIGLGGILVVFSGVWYFFAGKSAHIIYAAEDVNLRQIAQLLDDTLPLPPEMQNQIQAELERQQQRPSAQPTVWMLQAQLAMQQQDYKRAYQAYAQAYQLMPDDADIAVSYAQTWYLAEQQVTPELKDFLQQLQAQYPQQTGLINLLGVVAFNQGDYNKAIEYWQAILPQYAPNSSEAQTLQAALAQAKAKLQE